MIDLSYQLYSSRNHPPLEKTCAMLAETGYKRAESTAQSVDEAKNNAAIIKDHGLAVPCGHFSVKQVETEPDTVVAMAKEFGMDTVYSPYLLPDERPSDAAGWLAFGERLDKIGKPLVAAGIGFGWHNHDFEVQPLPDGSLPIDLIFAGGKDLEWQADLAWIERGGGDVKACIARHAKRITSLHIKDIAAAGECEDEDGWADVGHGVMDWPGLFKAAETCPVKYHIVEHDLPSDDRRFAQRSFAALSSML